ncbi:alpha/beta hydrolase [Micromonospora echinofusca]|uniref:alpha/beta fold hydrolase n=1 Tax=Micromonospora echinofusca TaxID=47858 RepID=UPI00342187BC
MTTPRATSQRVRAAEERFIPANDVELCVETFGDPGASPVLLISGTACSMDWWEDDLCRRLAAGDRFVIRYDHRDTGRSTGFPSGEPPYRFDDLVTDAAVLLEQLGVGPAHVCGVSMGGAVAQRLAIEHPHLVSSLTLLSTSPALRVNKRPHPDLPPISPALLASFAEERPTPDWTDRAAVIDHVVAGQRPLAGALAIEETRLRRIAGRMFDRSGDIAASLANHWMIDGGSDYRSSLSRIAVPALVIHGTEDPLFPFGHGEALADEIPDARLLPLAGVGHQMPPAATWETVVPAILAHTAG